MKLRVLGSAGAELPAFSPPGYLVDGRLLVDAGTVCNQLTAREQEAIGTVLVSHPHLDHIREIPILADNLLMSGYRRPVTVAAPAETIDAIRNHLMNGVIWPDFSRLPNPDNPVIRYRELELYREVELEGYLVTPVPVMHTVPAVGYVFRKEGKTYIYTGDTGPTEELWQNAGRADALITEVSFPDQQEELALMTGHLTPSLLVGELAKLESYPRRILITHLKPQFIEEIIRGLQALDIQGLELLKGGTTYDL